jgi:predicted ATPase/DNA-binding SARP family transcriptional activator
MSNLSGSHCLKVQLLGPPHIERDGIAVGLETRKALALLAFLAVTHQVHRRESLAAFFWPEHDREHGYANLRRALWALNSALGKEWLDAGHDSIGLAPDKGLELDVDSFREQVAVCHNDVRSHATVTAECISVLTCAAELYRGDFMAGISLADSAAFDDWQFFEAESLRREQAWLLERLARWHARQRQFSPAIAFARRWLALDPLHEPTHRELMALYAWDGQRAAALRQYGECAAVLKKELGVAPEAETTRLFESIRANQLPALPAEDPSPQPATAQEPHDNLPPQPTSLVGRDAELAEIAALLKDPACRLLTLVGAGGVGKTRLAIESASRNLPGQPGAIPARDGVYWVPLAAVSAARHIVPSIADAVGFSFFQQEGNEPRQELFNYLHEKQLLLILDNLEHLIEEAAELVSELVEQASGIKVIVTSRERLNIRSEWVFTVEGMGFPTDGDARAAAQYEAVQLFIQRARQADAHFAPSDEDMAEIVRICRLLEGLPLGIELAAAWASTLSCRGIATEIVRSLGFLSTSARDVPARHRSLQAVFDRSWQLLSEEQRQALARLSVFVGSFDRQAAERVAGADAQLLSALVAKSLVARMQPGRYGLHEVVCQFAAAKLDADPHERVAAMDRHCAFYTSFLESREQDMAAERQVAALDEVGQEIENLRAAWQWAVERRRWDDLRRAAGTLFAFYDTRTRLQEGEEAVAQAAVALEAARSLPGAASQPGIVEIERLLGLMLAYQAFFARWRPGDEQARAARDKSLALFERLGMQAEMAWVRTLAVGWGTPYFSHAAPVLIESLEILRQSNRPLLLVYIYVVLGNLASGLHRVMPRARQLLEEAVQYHRKLGDRYGTAAAEFSLGDFARTDGALPEALQHYTDSLKMRRELRDRRGISKCLDHVGLAARELGNLEQARQLHLESLEIWREIGEPLGIAESLDCLGLVALDEDDYGEATRYFLEAWTVRRQVGKAWEIGLSASHLGEVALRQGDYETAVTWYLESIESFRSIPGRDWLELALAGLGETCLALEQPGPARRHLRSALRRFALFGDHVAALWMLVVASQYLAYGGHIERAAEVLSAVLHHPGCVGNVRLRTRRALDELASRLPADILSALEGRSEASDLAQLAAVLLREI